jgi:hypothetical protein
MKQAGSRSSNPTRWKQISFCKPGGLLQDAAQMKVVVLCAEHFTVTDNIHCNHELFREVWFLN